MRARLLLGCAVSILAAACTGGSNSIEVTGPTTVKCQVTVANKLNGAAPAAGVASTIDITTTRDCTWTAASDTPWISISADTSGQGSGSVAYRVAANGEPLQRRGNVDVNNTQISIVQDPAPCRFSLAPPSAAVSSAGGAVTLTLDTLTGCAWTAASDAPWMTVTPQSGSRSGPIVVTIAANAGAARVGTVTVADAAVSISQDAAPPAGAPPPAPDPGAPPPPPAPAPCTYGIAPVSASVGAESLTGSVNVTAGAGCAWTAASHVSWISITSAASGSGNGSVAYRVAANTGAARTGTLTIAGKTFTVTQTAVACSYSIEPMSQSVGSDAASGNVTVTAGSTCAWTASSTVAWISIASGASGTGNGTVAFNVAANTGAARTGTLKIAGQTFTVTQAAAPPPPPAPCTFSISPTSASIADTGGSGSTAVTASAATCTWTATSAADWITITSGAAGTGAGTVAFNVAANSGAARSGTLTVAGQTFTVNQAAPPAPPPPPPCTFTIAPTSQTFDAIGGTGSVSVAASASTCTWTAASTADWITITSAPSGTGDGSVSFNVAANAGAARTATIAIAGQTFTITQNAP